MPRIQDYNLQTSVAGPERQTAANVEDTGNVGQAARMAGDQLESAGVLLDRRMGQADVASRASDLSAAVAKASIDYKTTLQTATKDDVYAGTGNGDQTQPTMYDKAMQGFDDAMGKISDSASTRAGREFVQRAVSAHRAAFSEQVAQGQATLAGAFAKQDTISTFQNYATAAINDPTSAKASHQALDAMVDAQVATAGLPAHMAPELRALGHEQVAKAEAQGWMQIGSQPIQLPDGSLTSAAKEKIKSGDFDDYIKGSDKEALLREADTHIHAAVADQRRQQQEAADAHSEVRDTTMSSYLQKMVGATPGQVSAKDIANDQRLTFEDKRSLINEMYTQQQRDAKAPGGARDQLWSRINAGDADPTKLRTTQDILNAPGTLKDKQWAITQLAKTPEAKEERQLDNTIIAGVRNQIYGPQFAGLKDQDRARAMSAFLSEYTDARDKAKQSGATKQQMYDPSSPAWLGNIGAKYKKTPQELMNQLSQSLRQTPTPQNPAAVGTVRVISPDGKEGNYKGTAEQAAKAGYKVK